MRVGFLGVPSCWASGVGQALRLLKLPVKYTVKSLPLTPPGVPALGTSCKWWGLKWALNTKDRRELPVNLRDVNLSWWYCAK